MIGENDGAKSLTFDQLSLVNEAYNFAGMYTFYGSPVFAERREPNLADVAFFASEQFMRELYELQLPHELPRFGEIYDQFDKRSSATLAPYPEPMAQLAPLRGF